MDADLEATYLALHITDYLQTRQIAKAPETYRELNPLLSEHPRIHQVNQYFVLTAIAHVAIAESLPKKYSKIFQLLV